MGETLYVWQRILSYPNDFLVSELILPGLVGEDKFSELEISKDNAAGVGLVHSRNNLQQKMEWIERWMNRS